MRYVVIDVETPNRKNDRISQFGIAIVECGCVAGWDEMLCNPEVSFDYINSQLTGIKEDDVLGCPTFPKLWEIISPYIEGSVIVAHGASFDLNVLHKCFLAYNIDEPLIRYCCTQKMARTMWPELGHYSLNSICDAIGIELDHHHAGSDAVAAAQVLLTLIDEGFDIEHEIKDFIPAAQKEVSFCVNQTISKKASINGLIELLDKISADDAISPIELFTLSHWLVSHEELADKCEYRDVVDLLNIILADGVMDESEQAELLGLCHKLVDPVAVSTPVQGINLKGSLVCLTGEFSHGSREEMEQLLKGQGAIISSGVVKKLDYLFVGGLGSDAWATANYGTKVRKALDLQTKGAKVQIVREDDLFKCVELKV